jgi:hypothetical protein
MKIWLWLAALPLAGCYTQLYTRGYAERSAYPYPYDRPAGDSAVADSLADSLAAADSGKVPNTVIVNNYYQDRASYRGYAIDAWDYPYVSLGFYSGRYRDYYGPYWWNDPYYHRRGYWRRYDGHAGGGGSGPTGPYRSDKRLFAPAPAQPMHKGRRSEPAAEPAPSPAPKAADPAPAESSGSSSGSSGGGSSSGSASGSSGSSSGSGNDHPDLHKGRRR